MIQTVPVNAWSTPIPPDAAKYASSPRPLTAVPDFAAAFASAIAVDPGLERPKSIVTPLVWLIHRHAVPSSATARAARVFAPGLNESSRPKFGLKSYIVWASTTELHEIASGVGFSSGGVVSLGALGELDGVTDVVGPGSEGSPDGSSAPGGRHPVSENTTARATRTAVAPVRVVRWKGLGVSTAPFSPTARGHPPCNAAESPDRRRIVAG